MSQIAVKAYLAVLSSDMLPTEITANIGVAPTRVVERGQRTAAWAPIASESRWYLDLVSTPTSSDFDSSLSEALGRLGLEVASALKILNQAGATVRLVLVQTISAQDPSTTLGIVIPVDVLTWLSAAGAHIDLDQYLDDCD